MATKISTTNDFGDRYHYAKFHYGLTRVFSPPSRVTEGIC